MGDFKEWRMRGKTCRITSSSAKFESDGGFWGEGKKKRKERKELKKE